MTDLAERVRRAREENRKKEEESKTEPVLLQKSVVALVTDDDGVVRQRFTVELEEIDWQRRKVIGTVKRYVGAQKERVAYDMVSGAPDMPARSETHGRLSKTSLGNLTRKRAARGQMTLF